MRKKICKVIVYIVICCSFPLSVVIIDCYNHGELGIGALWIIGVILAVWSIFLLWAEDEKRRYYKRKKSRLRQSTERENNKNTSLFYYFHSELSRRI